jgi:hypothetical protein
VWRKAWNRLFRRYPAGLPIALKTSVRCGCGRFFETIAGLTEAKNPAFAGKPRHAGPHWISATGTRPMR